MANFFIYSKDGDSLPLAVRLTVEGHRVRMYIASREGSNVGFGLVNRAASSAPKKDEIVIFDMTGFGKIADLMKKSGYKVIGGSSFTDKLERDRGYAITTMRLVDIAVPETVEFSSIIEGIRFIKKQDPKDGWYIKPYGENDCGDTYGSRDGEDMIRWLSYLATTSFKPKHFLLQKKMGEGHALSFEGWFDGDRWVPPWNSTIEDKKLFNGDIGPNTGWMANLVWAYEEVMPLMALKTLTRLAPLLRSYKYCGPFDINVIFDKSGTPHGLEYTPRFGYGALFSLMVLIKGDLGRQLEEFVNGTLTRFETENKYSLAINVSVPPYPSEASEAKGVPLDPKLLYDPNRIMLSDVMVDRYGNPVVTGRDGGVAAFCDSWHDLPELRSMLLGMIERYAIPRAQYRTDPVTRAESLFQFLQEHNYEVPMPKPLEYKAPKELPVVEEREHFFEIDNTQSPSGKPADVNTMDTSLGHSHPYDIPTSNT